MSHQTSGASTPDGPRADLRRAADGASPKHAEQEDAEEEEPPEPPPVTLEDFDPDDQEQLIESPRSLKACEAEGIDPEELFCVPLAAFRERGVPQRVVELRHTFWEAYRQDTVALARHARGLLVREEEGEEQPPHASHASHASSSVAGAGGIWAGALAPRHYPQTFAFFQDVRAATSADRLYERPKELPAKLDPNAPGKWSPGRKPAVPWADRKPHPRQQHIRTLLSAKDAQVSRRAVEEASAQVGLKLARLRGLPAGKGEQVAGLVLRSENLTGEPMLDRSQWLADAHRARRAVLEKQVRIANAQLHLIDDHLGEVQYLWEQRQRQFQLSQGEWATELQRTRAEAAAKREDHWLERRDEVHLAEIEAEERKGAALRRIVSRDLEKQRRVANMRDLVKIHYAQTWSERRAHWGMNRLAANRGVDAFIALTIYREEAGTARVEDQKLRLQALAEYRREVAALRKLFKELAAAREAKRKGFRRKAVVDELLRMAGEAQSASPEPSSKQRSLMTSTSSPNLSWTQSSFGSRSVRSDTTQLALSSTASRFPRFDWGRFGAEAVSPTSRSPKQRNLDASRSASEPSLLLDDGPSAPKAVGFAVG